MKQRFRVTIENKDSGEKAIYHAHPEYVKIEGKYGSVSCYPGRIPQMGDAGLEEITIRIQFPRQINRQAKIKAG